MANYSLNNRRYLGNKFKLLDFISEIIEKEKITFSSFCDIFAGTGVVGNFFNKKNIKVISNDILEANFVSLVTFLKATKKDFEKIPEYIEHLNNLKTTKKDNYVSINYGDKYFDYNNAIRIGEIREEIERMNLKPIEKNILLSSLVYSIDKIANTCGHYAAFRKKMSKYPEIKLNIPEINFESNLNNEIYKEDANILVSKINPDVIYLDPPYNSRQYFNSYHVLENIVKWNKPELEGITKQIKDRSKYKSEYCSNNAYNVFSDLIQKANCKYLIVSYNNTGEKLDARSNSKLSDTQIIEILSKKGKVTIHEKDYKYYTAGKNNNIKEHKERLYVCKVK
ncbi:DNA adenine methylase [Candidatus Gracilibacteria bacterium]|nr:DNA adenine methylase [Candidatus Gracilibacteria bacterium]